MYRKPPLFRVVAVYTILLDDYFLILYYRTATAIIPLVKGDRFSVYAKACYTTKENEILDWVEYVYKEEKENLEFADEIGDFGWLKYYSSEYKRGYRLSRKVYIK